MCYAILLFLVTATSVYRHLSSMVSLLTPTSGVLRMLVAHFNPWLYRRVFPQPQFTIHRTFFAPLAPASSLSAQPQASPIADFWKTVNAVVLRDHVVPRNSAKHIPVSLPVAVGTDACVDGHCRVHSLTVEPTFARVQEGQRSAVLVVNSSGAPVRLRGGTLLTEVLSYGTSLSLASLDSLSLSVGAIADNPNLRQRLLETLHKYRAAIALLGEPLGTTTLTEHSINIKPNVKPVYIPAYRLPHSQRELVNDQIKDMMKQGVIQHSRSPGTVRCSSFLKKDGTFRPVTDFRRVNEVTEDDRYPLPVSEDLLMNLGKGNQYFSSPDLRSGYWQVPMEPDSRKVTAFSTPQGHFVARNALWRKEGTHHLPEDD